AWACSAGVSTAAASIRLAARRSSARRGALPTATWWSSTSVGSLRKRTSSSRSRRTAPCSGRAVARSASWSSATARWAMRRRARAAMEAVDWSRVVGRFEQLLLGDAGREEDERAEQRALGGSGPVPHLRRRDRGEEARGLPLHAARSSADAGAAAEALPMGADASLLRRSVLPG